MDCPTILCHCKASLSTFSCISVASIYPFAINDFINPSFSQHSLKCIFSGDKLKFVCHCEERSDVAIYLIFLISIGSPRKLAMTELWRRSVQTIYYSTTSITFSFSFSFSTRSSMYAKISFLPLHFTLDEIMISGTFLMTFLYSALRASIYL